MAERDHDLISNLRELQCSCLHALGLLSALIAYTWLGYVIWPATGYGTPTTAVAGAIALAVGATVALGLSRRHLHAASVILVLASLLGVASLQLAARSWQVAFLFALPVVYANSLLDKWDAWAVTAIACLLCALAGRASPGVDPVTLRVSLPLLFVGLVAVATWLSARSLHTALEWVWSGYQDAHENQRAAREGQAELRRTLKALDEATYRLERANHMMAIARDQAEEARHLKQQFAQTISHELRTPLNIIVGFTEIMVQSPEYYRAALPPAFQRDLGIVHRNARHLQSLINDVLDLARIEAAQMSILPEECEPVALVEEALNTVRTLAECRGLTLDSELPPGLPTLYVDPMRIRQVFFNLLNNAARFTEHGSIVVRARHENDEVVFSVSDTGVGIAPEDLHRVFQEFQQLDGTTRRRHGGAGLGLAISKHLVELHGGRIWMDSQLGRGSTFHFSLPVHRTDLAQGLVMVAPQQLPRSDRERVLLAVTCSPSAASLITRYLRDWRTVVVQDLEQAQRAARQLVPQAVLLDMASVAADEQQLRAYANAWGLATIPFISCPLPGERPLQERLAADGYLIKPITREALWDTLRQFGERVDKILVIDDDRDFVRLLSRMLESPVRRYQLLRAYTVRDGMEMIEYHQPDLVLLDLVLPDEPGTEVISRLRASEAWRRLPVVIVSAQDEMTVLGPVSGAMVATKASGLEPGQIIRWVQSVLDVSARDPYTRTPARSGLEATRGTGAH